MNFWHIQVHPGNSAGWTIEDSRTVIRSQILGCSGKSVVTFQKVEVGDILLVRYGKYVLALVKCISKPAPTYLNTKTKHRWFDWEAKVEILKTFEHETIGGKGWYLPTTTQRIKNSVALDYVEKLLKASNP